MKEAPGLVTARKLSVVIQVLQALGCEFVTGVKLGEKKKNQPKTQQ